jgi:hypothetical protein
MPSIWRSPTARHSGAAFVTGGQLRGVCCVGGKQTSFPLCRLDQMARASSVKITVS